MSNSSNKQSHLSNYASTEDESTKLIDRQQESNSRSSISSIVYDIPEVHKSGVCSKSNPAWFGFCCCLGGFAMIALVTAGGLIGFRDKSKCSAVPQLPYLLIIYCVLVIIKVVEVCFKNFLALYHNVDWLVSWRRHPVLRHLLPLWGLLDIVFNMAILGALGLGVYWLVRAIERPDSGTCNDSLVTISYVSLSGFVGVFVFLILLVLVQLCGRLCRSCKSCCSGQRRRYRHGNINHKHSYGSTKDYYYGVHNHHHTHLHYEHSINNSHHDNHHDDNNQDQHHHPDVYNDNHYHHPHDFQDDFGFSFNGSVSHSLGNQESD